MLIVITEPCGCLPWGRHSNNCSGKRWEREIDAAIEKMLKEFRRVLKKRDV